MKTGKSILNIAIAAMASISMITAISEVAHADRVGNPNGDGAFALEAQSENSLKLPEHLVLLNKFEAAKNNMIQAVRIDNDNLNLLEGNIRQISYRPDTENNTCLFDPNSEKKIFIATEPCTRQEFYYSNSYAFNQKGSLHIYLGTSSIKNSSDFRITGRIAMPMYEKILSKYGTSNDFFLTENSQNEPGLSVAYKPGDFVAPAIPSVEIVFDKNSSLLKVKNDKWANIRQISKNEFIVVNYWRGYSRNEALDNYYNQDYPSSKFINFKDIINFDLDSKITIGSLAYNTKLFFRQDYVTAKISMVDLLDFAIYKKRFDSKSYHGAEDLICEKDRMGLIESIRLKAMPDSKYSLPLTSLFTMRKSDYERNFKKSDKIDEADLLNFLNTNSFIKDDIEKNITLALSHLQMFNEYIGKPCSIHYFKSE
ncbi:MAG: hypothetical protein ACOYOK_07740 [Pseudobdellovibrionaceae bacterium]